MLSCDAKVKEKHIKIKQNRSLLIVFALLFILFVPLPIASAYPVEPQMMNLFDLIVVELAGNFAIAFLMLLFVTGLILVFGGLSIASIIFYEALFMLALSTGYSRFTMAISTIIIVIFMSINIWKWVNQT